MFQDFLSYSTNEASHDTESEEWAAFIDSGKASIYAEAKWNKEEKKYIFLEQLLINPAYERGELEANAPVRNHELDGQWGMDMMVS